MPRLHNATLFISYCFMRSCLLKCSLINNKLWDTEKLYPSKAKYEAFKSSWSTLSADYDGSRF